ncbi:hypothetical protein [Pelobacter propionicus]|uniref:Uncharacterized protein n=1 Tax=Pelobacter propionicus (strain DSM 2379 / NBRC 103807 / OttBd1) TaxID=338966 RepID=A1ATQ2_PELPD|nr:hypothetical protein [Pelobacter propionicus]ABL00723.1 hypothetical protein Ppro_3129 [Pelobacter propionicus DSM 2379]
MGTTNNWMADGLNAYVSLARQGLAERKLEVDMETKNQQMQLATNQDQRSAASAGLSNQATQLQIDEAKTKQSERTNFQSQLRDYITMKTAANPSIPNTLDPAEIERSTQEAYNLAHTANMLGQLPDNTAQSFGVKDLPPYAQQVLVEGPGKAARLRAGTVHKDPNTGMEYSVTGDLGPVHVVKKPGQPAVIMPTMMVAGKDANGQVVSWEVPFTENKSNDPNDQVRAITPDFLMYRAGNQLAALKKAQEKGISPAVASAEDKYNMILSMPYEKQLEWWQGVMKNETAKREKYVTDAAVARAAQPYADQIKKLSGTPEQKRTSATAIMLGAPSEVVDHLLKSSKAVNDMFPDSKRNVVVANTGDGVYAVDGVTGQKVSKIGGPTKVPNYGGGKSSGGGRSRSGSSSSELKPRERLTSIDKDIKELHTDNRALQKELRITYDREGKSGINQAIAENNRRLKELSGEKSAIMGRGGGQAPQQPTKPPLTSFISNSGNSVTPLSQRFGLTF